MTVEYEEGRFVDYTFKQLDELELAYATTIHKAPGQRISGSGHTAAGRPQDAYDQESAVYGSDPGQKVRGSHRERGDLSGDD